MAGKKHDKQRKAGGGMGARLNAGVALQMKGDYAGAEAVYRDLLREHPHNADVLLYLGVLLVQRREYPQAQELLEKARAKGADPEMYHINAGLCALRMGQMDKAQTLLQEAVRLTPLRPEAHLNLGIALHALRRFDDALASFARARELDPADGKVRLHTGWTLQALNRHDEALAHFAAVLEREPDHARANVGYALSLLRSARKQEALPYIRRARAADPQNPEVCADCGHMFASAGLPAEARTAYEDALRLRPDYADALMGMGRLLVDQGRPEEGRPYLDRASELQPESFSACFGRAVALMRSNTREALTWCEKAIQLNPSSEEAIGCKGHILGILGRSGEAEACLRQAISMNPRQPGLYQNLANVLVAQGRVAECLEANRAGFELDPTNHHLFSNILLYSHYLAQNSREELWRQHQNYDAMYRAQMQVGPVPGFANVRDPNKRLRVGIVSADFRHHSCAFFLFALLRGHDRSRLEIYAYSSVRVKDANSKILLDQCAATRDIIGLSDQQAAGVIYRDQVDVLIDLGGHTADNRLPIFLYKPAPVQLAWLGYPDTTGLTTMDYRITDAYADPPGSEAFSSEKLLRFPGGFHCFVLGQGMPEPGELPSLQTGYVTFGSFNNFAKVSDETVFLWSEVLKNTPQSKLLLKALGVDDPAVQERIYERFARVGIPRERLELVGRITRSSDHVELYNRVDIALDTYPYNGTTTTFEALVMGVPVVTLGGDTHASLVGRSILSNCGLGELTCRTVGEFINKAVALAKDRTLLLDLRKTLRGRLQASPLMDEAGFCRKFEDGLRLVWRRFCQESPVAAQVQIRPADAAGNDIGAQPFAAPASAGAGAAPAAAGGLSGSGANAAVNAANNAAAQVLIPLKRDGLRLSFWGATTPPQPQDSAGAPAPTMALRF